MKAVPLVLAAAACQSAPVPAQAACSVTVSFGSYAMGIDAGAAAAIDKLLASSKDVKTVTRTGGGREGEYALCVQTRNKADAARVVEQIRAILPAKPRGPIRVEGAGKRIDAPTR
jgi:hypothetical protein